MTQSIKLDTDMLDSTKEEIEQEIIINDEAPEQKEESVTDTEQPSTARKGHKFKLDFPLTQPSDGKPQAGNETLVLPAMFFKDTSEIMESSPNISILDNPESRIWAETVRDGTSYLTSEEALVPTLEDTNAEFRQYIDHNNVNLLAQSPKLGNLENANLKGERAILRFVNHLGLGTLFQVPLWHSGIWVTFKPPSESEIVDLNRVLMSDKINLGRATYGLLHSNLTVYTQNRLLDFVIAHVYELSTKSEDINIENLKDHIVPQDIGNLLWGFICTMYPKGYNYKTACTTDPQKCQFVLEETLNVSKLQWTNKNALTDWQKTHMVDRGQKRKDLESVNRYKEELSKASWSKLEINKDTDQAISITFKTPSVTEYISSGYKWVDDIVSNVESVLSSSANYDERNNLMISHAQASLMRQYGHFVKEIEYGSNVVTDKETVDSLLSILSSDDAVREQFHKGVMDYINSSTISLIGIPTFSCPKCGTKNKGTSLNEHIIPLDVVSLFFGLIIQRVTRILER
jgi:hypothetical protein